MDSGQGGEGGEWEGSVGGRTGFDEGGGESVDGGGREWGAVWRGRGGDASGGTLERGVESFGNEDGSRDGEVVFGSYEAGAAEIGGGANTLEDGGQCDEGVDLGWDC